ncbi:hypothetical protein Tco_0400014 [Tanacetum coccineum]
MFALEIKGLEGEKCLEEDESDMIEYELSDTPHISLNALSGVPTHNTMRAKGHVLKQILHILMDSRSTHNFLDLYTAKKMGRRIRSRGEHTGSDQTYFGPVLGPYSPLIRSTCPLQVTKGDGNIIVSQHMVKDFQWKIQGVLFETDVMLFPLGGQKVVLRGTYQAELAWLTGKKLSKLVSQTVNVQVSSLCCVEQSATLHLMHYNDDQGSHMNEEMNQLLKEYADVFTMPKELPPHKSFDHQISFKTDNVSINIRPCRYPSTQKDTIEAMIKELVDSGVVRPSGSPF